MNKRVKKCERPFVFYTKHEKCLEIAIVMSYIITRKRNKIFGVGCNSQPAV